MYKNRKGKTYEELYGEEKAKQIKNKIANTVSKQLKGLTYQQRYGIKKSKLIREKQSKSKKGKKVSKCTKQKLSIYRKGKTYEELYGKEKAKQIKNKQSIIRIGHPTYKDKNRNKNISNALKGRKLSKLHCKKLSRYRKGKTYEELYGKEKAKKIKKKLQKFKGKSYDDIYDKETANRMKKYIKRNLEEKCGKERAINIKEKLRNIHLGNKNYNYKLGNSREPYDLRFDKYLKKQVMERDKNICQVCKGKVIKGNCHHIHYNKKDSRPETLVWTHHKCNSRVNTNKDYWFSYFCYLKGIEPEVLLC